MNYGGGSLHLKTYSNEDVEIKRDEDEMRYAIKRIRMRAGVPDYTNETYKNQADFRVKLKRGTASGIVRRKQYALF